MTSDLQPEAEQRRYSGFEPYPTQNTRDKSTLNF